jgi:hypothetical protein
MIQRWLREDKQAVAELEVVGSDRARYTVPAMIDTEFNG